MRGHFLMNSLMFLSMLRKGLSQRHLGHLFHCVCMCFRCLRCLRTYASVIKLKIGYGKMYIISLHAFVYINIYVEHFQILTFHPTLMYKHLNSMIPVLLFSLLNKVYFSYSFTFIKH